MKQNLLGAGLYQAPCMSPVSKNYVGTRYWKLGADSGNRNRGRSFDCRFSPPMKENTFTKEVGS